jgi:hypothetical protein
MRNTHAAAMASALLLLASSPASLGLGRDSKIDKPSASCASAIRYRIGTVDSRFGISREEFQRAVEDAGKIWENDQKLFQYDPKAGLPVNLIYDTRQEMTQRVMAARTSIQARLKEADQIHDKLALLQEDIQALNGPYSERLAAYERARDSYNQVVRNMNLAGGAGESELRMLTRDRQSLNEQQKLLEVKRQTLNRATDTFNDLAKKHNALLTLANAQASAMNASSGGVKFEEGRYIKEGNREWIDIFQFENKVSLLVILAHELGHALGMKHNENASSVMSSLIHTDHFALTAEDEKGLKAVCAPR